MSPAPTSFAQRCGLDAPPQQAARDWAATQIHTSGVELVRVAWCDLHGMLRGKTLTAAAAIKALKAGVGMVGTLMLKDTSDRTVFKVFEPGGTVSIPGFAGASNLMLLPDPGSFRTLPWVSSTGWLQGQPWYQDGRAVALDTRRVLQHALQRLAQHGLGLVCGLEVEFHIYRIRDALHGPDLDPELADWPGLPPAVSLIHPGYNLLSEAWMDMAEEPLRIVQHTAQALGLPLTSLEIELGPSQVEAVFDATDALTAADNMVLFRSAVRQALRRAGYHATFMCRPPFPHIMSSGWHLHQSLVDLTSGANQMVRAEPAPGTTPRDASHTLSDTGAAWLAGLLAHARGMAALCAPTLSGFARFQPNALAPNAVLWGADNRGAMLRVVGTPGDPATRIENRLGEPAANPYLYMAAQIYAGLDGLEANLTPPPATEDPYGTQPAAPASSAAAATTTTPQSLPATLTEALQALRADPVLTSGLSQNFVDYFVRAKESEIRRHAEAADPVDFARREYFGRI